MDYNREHRRRAWLTEATDFGVPQGSELERWVEPLSRTFDFRPLSNVLPPVTAQRVAETLCAYLQHFARKTAIGRFIEFMRFIGWLNTKEELKSLLLASSTQHEIKPADAWCASAKEWGALTREQCGPKFTTLAERYGGLFLCLDALTKVGLAPKVEKPKLPYNYHLTGGRRLSLPELQSGKATSAISNHVHEHILEQFGSAESDDARRYLEALSYQDCDEVADDEVAFAEKLQQKNRSLLDKIRLVAEDKFLHWRRAYQRGQELLLMSEPDGLPSFSELLQADTATWIELTGSLFPEQNPDLSTARFLRMLSDCYGDRAPSANETTNVQRYESLLRRFGGRFTIDAMLTAHADAVAAAMILYLCDSGANPSTALELTTDFEEPTDNPNRVRVRSRKPRAGYATIVDTLPITDPSVRVTAVEALRGIKLMTDKRRARYPSLGDKLFVFTFRGKPAQANSDFLDNRIQYFVRDSKLAERFRAGAIRSSVIIDVAFHNMGNIRAVNSFAHHNGHGGTTERYVMSWPVRLILTRQIRVFQRLLEATLVFEIEGGFDRLGVSKEQGIKLRQQAIRTGLGISCRGGVGNSDTETGQAACENFGTCPNCSRQLFVVDKHNLAELVAIKAILTERQADLELRSPGQWEQYWVPLLAYATVVIERVENSHFARYLGEARKSAQSLLASGYDPTLLRS